MSHEGGSVGACQAAGFEAAVVGSVVGGTQEDGFMPAPCEPGLGPAAADTHAAPPSTPTGELSVRPLAPCVSAEGPGEVIG